MVGLPDGEKTLNEDYGIGIGIPGLQIAIPNSS